MNEIIFLIEKAIEESIFTEVVTLEETKSNIKDAVECHWVHFNLWHGPR